MQKLIFWNGTFCQKLTGCKFFSIQKWYVSSFWVQDLTHTKNFNSKVVYELVFQVLASKCLILKTLQGMFNFCYPNDCGVNSFVGFSIVAGLMVAVMGLSLWLSINIYSSLWDSKVSFERFHFKSYWINEIITITIYKAIYKFCQVQLIFSLFNFSISFRKDWSTSLRWFCLLKKPESLILVLFQEFSCNAGHSVDSFGSLIETDCSLDIIKHLSTLGNDFVTESTFEMRKKTVHVLIAEAECVQLLEQFFKVSY